MKSRSLRKNKKRFSRKKLLLRRKLRRQKLLLYKTQTFLLKPKALLSVRKDKKLYKLKHAPSFFLLRPLLGTRALYFLKLKQNLKLLIRKNTKYTVTKRKRRFRMWVRRRKLLKNKTKTRNTLNFRKTQSVLKLHKVFTSKSWQLLKARLTGARHVLLNSTISSRGLQKRERLRVKPNYVKNKKKLKHFIRIKRNYLTRKYLNSTKPATTAFQTRAYMGVKKHLRYLLNTSLILGRPYYSSKLLGRRSSGSIGLFRKSSRKWFVSSILTRGASTSLHCLHLPNYIRTLRLLTNSLFIPDSIVPHTFYSSSSHFFSCHFRLDKDRVHTPNPRFSFYVSNPLTPALVLNLALLSNVNDYTTNHPKSTYAPSSTSGTFYPRISVSALNNTFLSHQELLWTGLSFSFVTSWSKTKFSYFFKRSKIYLAIYLVAARYFLTHSTFYTSTVDQGSFKSSVFSLTTLSKLSGSYFIQNKKTSFFSTNSHYPNFNVTKGQTYIRYRKSFFKIILKRKKLTKYLSSLRLTTPLKYSTTLAKLSNNLFLGPNFVPNRLYLKFKLSHLLKHYRKFRAYSRLYFKQSLKPFSKVCHLLYKKHVLISLLKKRLRRRRRRLRRFTSRFTKLSKTHWWIQSRVWVNKLLSSVNNIYVPTLFRNNILGLNVPRYFNRYPEHSYLPLYSTSNNFSNSRLYNYKNQFSYPVSLTKPGRNYTPYISHLLDLNKHSKKNEFFFFIKSILLLKHIYYTNAYPSFRTAALAISGGYSKPLLLTNLLPDTAFNLISRKSLNSARANVFFQENVTSWMYAALIKFIEFHSGKLVLIDVDSFMAQGIDSHYRTLYKFWLGRFNYYERRLGHRFFLEEALHILHMSFTYRDSKLMSTWLKAIIQRISFWKTRFIFRFLKYLLNNYFSFLIRDLGIAGLKIQLKGKISVAGNSRKRTILYRLGKTSHAEARLKVVHTMDTIITFTGVMGFQVWIFY